MQYVIDAAFPSFGLASADGPDQQAVLGVDGEVAAVEEGVDVQAQEKSVVEAVLSSGGERADVRGLQDDLGAGDSAASVVSL